MKTNTKYTILSDIHTNYERAEQIIKHEGADVNILLGDYFDEFGDTPEDNAQTAYWVKSNLGKDNYIFLLGNHDVAYFYPSTFTLCSGNTNAKLMTISEFLQPSDVRKFKWFHWLDDKTLLSHSGLSEIFLPEKGLPLNDIKQFLDEESKKAYIALAKKESHWFFRAGFARGGRSQPVGGLTWLDWEDEFLPVKGLNQIVGHTPGRGVRTREGEDSVNYCIDNHLYSYITYIDGKVEIKKIDDI